MIFSCHFVLLFRLYIQKKVQNGGRTYGGTRTPTRPGFGDQRSTNWATHVYIFWGSSETWTHLNSFADCHLTNRTWNLVVVARTGVEPVTLRLWLSRSPSWATSPKKRKGEDGSVDNPFYERHYLGLCLQTPTSTTDINSRASVNVFPRSTFSAPGRIRTYTLRRDQFYRLAGGPIAQLTHVFCAPSWDRTRDPLHVRQVLLPLS